jgi:putative DNA primase/helicase
MATQNNSQQTLQFNYAHLLEWMKDSGVDHRITERSIESLTDRKVIAKKLGWKKYPDNFPLGWWASGLDLITMKPQKFGQFKPDEKILINGDEAKYLTAKGEYDAIALPHPDPEYWQRVLDDVSIPVDLDEGAKKSGAGMTCGFPSLALCGVTLWQFKDELVSNLAAVAVPGRTIRIRFDMDLLFKEGVLCEVKKLAKALMKKGCNVLVAMWDKGLGLKIDDVLVKHGEEMVKKIMAYAVPYPQWLKNLEAQVSDTDEARDTADKKKSKQPPTPQVITARLAEEFGHQLKYDEEQQTWRKWSGKHWEKMGLGAFKTWLKNTLDGKGVKYGGSAYLEDVRKLLECDLRQLKWQFWDKSRYINFNNCVFDGAKAKSVPHSPGMGFTSHLPYDYKPLEGDLGDSLEALRVNCPKVHKFLRTTMKGDERKMFKLLAIINALLKYRFFDLQMFVHLVGAPGSGKGKFMRFCQKLVGKGNTIACQLDKLGDGSTKASLMDKQLVVFPDERKPVGIDSILSLTGGDEISYRELYQPAASAHFYGSIMIASNKPIFIGDTTGLERRLCLVQFDNPIAVEERKHSLEQELDSEIPACIAIALSLTDDAVTQAIQGIGGSQIAEFKAKEWEMKTETNSVATFLDMALVLDPLASTPTMKLFEEYKDFCEVGGFKPLSLVKFPKYLADLLSDEKMDAMWVKGRPSTFEGLRLRRNEDEHLTHSEYLALAPVDTLTCTSFAPVDTPVASLQDKGLHQLHQLDSKLLTRSENEDDYIPDTDESDSEKDLPPSTGATGANPVPVRDTTPASTGTPTGTPTGAKPQHSPQLSDREIARENKRVRVETLADEMRSILSNPNHEQAWEIWNQIKNDPQSRGFFEQALTDEENRKARVLLFVVNFPEGTSLKCNSKKYGTQFEGVELKLYDAKGNGEITCRKPDGSFVNLPIRDVRPL